LFRKTYGIENAFLTLENKTLIMNQLNEINLSDLSEEARAAVLESGLVQSFLLGLDIGAKDES
jgi:hypothetical protein